MRLSDYFTLALIGALMGEGIIRQRKRNWFIQRDPNLKPQSARFYSFEKISKLEPHLNCDYLTSEFWHEMQSLTKDRSGIKMINNFGDQYLVAKDCPGKFFTVKNNLRTTLFPPSDSDQNYFLFGSSTLHNFEVPNDLTTASNLQRLLSESGHKITVLNYGVSGATLENNFARMRAMNDEFKKDDLIIVLFGINDVGVDTYSNFEIIPLKILRRLGEHTLLLRAIHRLLARNSWKRHSKITAHRKLKLLEEMNIWAISKSVKFCAILEPVVHLKKNPGDYEITLRRVFGQKLDYLYRFGYDEFSRLLNFEHTLSAINVFNETSPSVFLDQAHINSVGTEILAKEIFRLTSPFLK